MAKALLSSARRAASSSGRTSDISCRIAIAGARAASSPIDLVAIAFARSRASFLPDSFRLLYPRLRLSELPLAPGARGSTLSPHAPRFRKRQRRCDEAPPGCEPQPRRVRRRAAARAAGVALVLCTWRTLSSVCLLRRRQMVADVEGGRLPARTYAVAADERDAHAGQQQPPLGIVRGHCVRAIGSSLCLWPDAFGAPDQKRCSAAVRMDADAVLAGAL